MELVRARCEETGHVAALPDVALELGMIPGWVRADGPVPDGPKVAAFPPKAGGEKPSTKTAGGKSAENKE